VVTDSNPVTTYLTTLVCDLSSGNEFCSLAVFLFEYLSEEEMASNVKKYRNFIPGPDGSPMTLTDLPPTGTERWVSRHKAAVVAGVDGGLISLEDACRRYAMSVEEFLSWQRAYDRYGQSGLRATKSKSRDKHAAAGERAA
jgi:hypothetical protein